MEKTRDAPHAGKGWKSWSTRKKFLVVSLILLVVAAGIGIGIGVGLDSVDYVNFLADAAHSRGMSIGLKNAGSIIPSVIGQMQWSVNEQCVQNNECSTYEAFINASKPVFHIEYPKNVTDDDISVSQSVPACKSDDSNGFSTILKNLNLDTWIQMCQPASN
ncbi:hypothetical protein Egran_04419 [Elaphomyces granulatus]|uniref:alpha-galactosidase n=1 Tax=Elaphomyces granulatus TaxID=519963 RepID=A0A232LUI4_9EURO|nr:hypothetical protein Egran_04419 [Elaphomyces granulatus]